MARPHGRGRAPPTRRGLHRARPVPELPEVEVVRRGLAEHVLDRTIAASRSPTRARCAATSPGGADFAARLAGRTITAARRRGKYLWLELDGGAPRRRRRARAPRDERADARRRPRHGRTRSTCASACVFDDDGPELRFVDQRTFGGLSRAPAGRRPSAAACCPRRSRTSPATRWTRRSTSTTPSPRIRRRRTELKRALLDQTVVSGHRQHLRRRGAVAGAAARRAADREAHPRAGPGGADRRRRGDGRRAGAGGTSFDALYVNVNGASGYFDRSLAAYGQADRPCPRCGTPIRREPFMNRGSFSCPRCQPRPRRAQYSQSLRLNSAHSSAAGQRPSAAARTGSPAPSAARACGRSSCRRSPATSVGAKAIAAHDEIRLTCSFCSKPASVMPGHLLVLPLPDEGGLHVHHVRQQRLKFSTRSSTRVAWSSTSRSPAPQLEVGAVAVLAELPPQLREDVAAAARRPGGRR